MSLASGPLPGPFLLVFLIGLLPACALLLPRLRPAAMAVAPWTALPSLVMALSSTPDLELDLPWVLLGARLGMDATGQVFLFFTALLWWVSGIYARSYLEDDPEIHRFFACFLLTMTGNLGLILSLDMASFYCFFAVMSFASYGLIVHHGDREALRAGRVYMMMVILGEVLLFAALVIAASESQHLAFREVTAFLRSSPRRDWIIALALAGFGIKAGALPLHSWLPLAHPAAPTPASAVLSGAMIKAGLLGWLRFLPLGVVALPGWAALTMAAGVAALFLGAALGAVQRDPKAILAYSSISQMGLMTVGLGIGLAAPEHWQTTLVALQLFALHHALAKGALFLGVGAAATTLTGPWQRRAVAVGLMLPALSLAGAPWTSGAAAKTALKAAAKAVPWPTWLDWSLSLGSIATTLVMARFVLEVWPRGPAAHHRLDGVALTAWSLLLAAVLGVVWVVPWPSIRGPLREGLSFAAFRTALWPVLIGAALAWRLARSRRGRLLVGRLQIPAGDLAALAERGWSALRRRPGGGPEEARSRWPGQKWRAPLERATVRIEEAATILEQSLTGWTVGGSAFLVIIGVLVWLLTR